MVSNRDVDRGYISEERIESLEWTYRGVVVGKSVVYRHVLEVPANVLVEETLDFFEVEFRINEEGSDV